MIGHVHINNFRKFHNIEFRLGKKITVISGQNATGKSTLLGLLGATAELKTRIGTPILKKQFRAEFSEMFTASQANDPRITKAMTISLYSNGDWENHSERYDCRAGWWSNPDRYRIIPKRTKPNGKKTEAKVEWPSLYLGLSRLYPIGESEDLISRKFRSLLNDEEKAHISKQYRDILFQEETVTEILGVNPTDARRKQGIGANTDTYDYLCNSAGQDNLGQILLAVLSFKKLKERMGENWQGGLLLIDEFDATLHPSSQEALFEYLLVQCEEIGIQTAFTTHSLYLLEHISNKVKNNVEGVNNDIELVYLTTANGPLEKKVNPAYDIIKYDLNMKLKKENTEKIKIYCEDDEAKYFASALLKDFAERIYFINYKAGCDQLIDLFKSDKYFQEEVLIFLDGDSYSKYCNLIGNYPKANIVFSLLPLREQSPEETIYDYMFNDSASENLIACFDDTSGHSIRSLKHNYDLKQNSNLKKRVIYKDWFKKINKDHPSLIKRIISAWIMDHPREVERFTNNFKNNYNILAIKKSISQI